MSDLLSAPIATFASTPPGEPLTLDALLAVIRDAEACRERSEAALARLGPLIPLAGLPIETRPGAMTPDGTPVVPLDALPVVRFCGDLFAVTDRRFTGGLGVREFFGTPREGVPGILPSEGF